MVFVPVGNEKLVNEMKKVLTKEEINSIIEEVALSDVGWIEDDSLRKTKYKEILSNSDRCEIMKMIKSLYLHQIELYKNKKKPRISDELFFKEAERLLCQEFAYVFDLSLEEVVPFICRECEKYISP